ncbi:hypothetical protein ACLB2K_053103 [Fragaria x ananassa]
MNARLRLNFQEKSLLNLLLIVPISVVLQVQIFLSKDDDLTSSGGAMRMLLDDGGTTDLSDCLDSLESYFQIGTNDISKRGSSMSPVQKNLKDYLLPYYNALEFLCLPLIDIVYSGKKQIIADNGAAFVSNGLRVIQSAFHQLYDVFLSLQTITCDIDIDGVRLNIILHASVAACKLKVSSADLSKHTILDVLNDSFTVSAFLLDILNQVDHHVVKRAMVECLETWSTAANLFGKLPGPMSVVKHWMECKCCNNVHIEDSCPTFYSLLSSFKNLSKKTTEILLEQGLLAYEQMYAVNPEFCQKMQMQIINILLQDVYVIPDSWLQKARILARKGRWLKLYGINGLKDSICCLTEAITLLSKTHANTSIHETSTRHELAVAYCLLALCTQEDEPQSEKMFQDIRAALDAWLGISTTEMCSPDEKCFMVSESTITLLDNILICYLSRVTWIIIMIYIGF